MPSFAQFLCQAQILILKILYVFLWLKFSPSLNLNEIEHFSKVLNNSNTSCYLDYLGFFSLISIYPQFCPI